MTEKQPPRTSILPSDIDTQGNVTLWDHGPQEPKKFPKDTEEQAKVRREAAEREAKAWHDEHGDMAQPLVMHSSDAGQAMAIEPGRYALEPDDIDEGEVEKRVKEIQDKRAAALLFAQTVIDRKVVIAQIMSERQAKVLADETEPEETVAPAPQPRESDPPTHKPEPGYTPVSPPLRQPGDTLNV